MQPDSKLSSNLVWIFALATLAVVIAVTYIVPHVAGPLSPKAYAAIYFVLTFAGAAASTYLTRTGALLNIAAFALVGISIGIFYYVVIGRAMAAAAGSLGAGGSSAGIGAATGLVFGIAFAVDALAAGIGGTLLGMKVKKGLPQVAAKLPVR